MNTRKSVIRVFRLKWFSLSFLTIRFDCHSYRPSVLFMKMTSVHSASWQHVFELSSVTLHVSNTCSPLPESRIYERHLCWVWIFVREIWIIFVLNRSFAYRFLQNLDGYTKVLDKTDPDNWNYFQHSTSTTWSRCKTIKPRFDRQ